jgi:hypothetical protein
VDRFRLGWQRVTHRLLVNPILIPVAVADVIVLGTARSFSSVEGAEV